MTVTLEPDRPERILEWIIGEQYDCGITDGFLGHPATHSQDLFMRSVCILPKGHFLQEKTHVTPTDLAGEKMIHTRRDSRFYQHLSRAFSDHGAAIDSLVEVRQFTTACTMVRDGMGASVVSAIDAEGFPQGRDRHPPLPAGDLSPPVDPAPGLGAKLAGGAGFHRRLRREPAPFLATDGQKGGAIVYHTP